MEKTITDLPFDYQTIKTTKSRIDKGLLAIPVSLMGIFPKTKKKILISDLSGNCNEKNFVPYTSSSKECRIGGMKQFYEKYNIQDDDEIIIVKKEENTFGLYPEKQISNLMQKSLKTFQKDVSKAEMQLQNISKLISIPKKELLQNQFVNLSNLEIKKRKKNLIKARKIKESVPFYIRKILSELYKGKCQLSNFTFTMRNGQPYFEIHHINPNLGNHFKNLLVVSPNIHAQFTYSNLKQTFDDAGWLREVSFNKVNYPVFQMIDHLPICFEKEIHA